LIPCGSGWLAIIPLPADTPFTKGSMCRGPSLAAVHASGKSRSKVSSVAGVRVNVDRHSSRKAAGMLRMSVMTLERAWKDWTG